MKKYKILENIINSFNNEKTGFAARKLTAFQIIVLITIADLYYIFNTNFHLPNFINWLIVHFCAASFFLGLVTFQNLIELKNGKKSNDGQQG